MKAISCHGLACLFSLALFTGSYAAPSLPCTHKVKETVVPPRGWTQSGPPPADHTIALRIGLPQPDFHLLEKQLYEVSDPSHARYGAHLSKEEVEELVAPHPDSLDAVNTWLSTHGLTENDFVRSPAKDWVTLTIPISLAEKMLDTKYSIWTHEASGDRIVRTTSYSLPEDLHEHVDVIQPTTMFAQLKKMRSTSLFADETDSLPFNEFKDAAPVLTSDGVAVDASCNTTITLKCLQQLYNFVGYKPTAKGNSIGITGYLEEYANIQDLQSFYAAQRPEAINSSYIYHSVKGGQNNQTLSESGAEAALDGTFWSTAGSPPFKPDSRTPENTNELRGQVSCNIRDLTNVMNRPYTDWLEYVLSHGKIPLSISTSYGDDEQTVRDDETDKHVTVPKSYAQRVCASFAQLGAFFLQSHTHADLTIITGARGTSLLFSSGDWGVGDNNPNPETQQCFTNDGRNVTRFIPLFPASVTSVGGTVHYPEEAVSRFFSGGGFSDYFPRPWYQEKAAGDYVKALGKETYKGLYNPEGRGIPDVAAQSDRFSIFLAGVPRLIGGTSASAPAFAGIVALLNDVRLGNGLPPLGFLNPLLYTKGLTGFNDVTIGHNSGCGTTGFNATVGWDPG
ncbi:hypothetical protein DXG01_007656 [Tephrocybe rancida]|nr:hypothetical protein DXG01_007656 [Tephrocybe rancida]